MTAPDPGALLGDLLGRPHDGEDLRHHSPAGCRGCRGDGAAAIGFIFWPDSPRFIDPYRARNIARTLPPFVSTVGVFVNQPKEYINGVASLVPLSVVQLHGDEPPAFAARLSRPVMKAITRPESARSGQSRSCCCSTPTIRSSVVEPDAWSIGRSRPRSRASGGLCWQVA